MRESTQRLLVALLGLTLFCMVAATSDWLMHDPALFWSSCCRVLTLLMPTIVTTWLSVLTRIGVTVVLMTGFCLMIRQLWHSYRFLARLNLVSLLDKSLVLPPELIAVCAELGLTQRIVVLSTRVPLAFCFGLLKPRICISTGLLATLSGKELKAVLLHEYHHQRHFDPLRTLIVDSVATLLFFLPVVAEWRDLFRTATELAADRFSIMRIGRTSLAGALHKLLTHPLTMQDSFFLSGINGLSATEARMAYLLDDTPMCWRFSTKRLLQSSIFLLLICMMLQTSSF